MQLQVSFRNLNARDEVRSRAQVLFDKLERFLDPAAEGQLTVAVEHGTAAIEVHVTSRGHVFKSNEEDEDLRTALDRAFHRLEMQLRRAKERRVDRHRRGSDEPELEGEIIADDEEYALEG